MTMNQNNHKKKGRLQPLIRNAMAILLLIGSAFISGALFAQVPITVKGKVTDDKNAPIAGASVTVKNGTGGTSTSVSGDYTISVDPKGTLVFSSTGLSTQEINVAGKTVINVNLTANTT